MSSPVARIALGGFQRPTVNLSGRSYTTAPARRYTGPDEYDPVDYEFNSVQEPPRQSPMDLSAPVAPFASFAKKPTSKPALNTLSQASTQVPSRPPLAALSNNARVAPQTPQSEAASNQTTRRRNTSELSSNITAPPSGPLRRSSRVVPTRALGVGEVTDINEPLVSTTSKRSAEEAGLGDEGQSGSDTKWVEKRPRCKPHSAIYGPPEESDDDDEEHTSCKHARVEDDDDDDDEDYVDEDEKHEEVADIDAALERLENDVEGGYLGSDQVGDTANFEKGIRQVIRTAQSQARAVDFGNIPNSRFCPQIWKLLASPVDRERLSEDQIWDIIRKATTPERQAILGSGDLSDKLVDQLPRASAKELLGSLVYLDWIQRPRRRFAYVGVGQGKDGGGTRLVKYEKAKQNSNRDLKQADSEGNHHLDVGLHKDATMNLRVILAHPKSPTVDIGVLCEGLMADFLRVIDPDAPQRISPSGIDAHNESMMQDCKAAQPSPRGNAQSFTGLNQSSPLRQGSGQLPGSLWGWRSGVSAEQLEALRRCLKLTRQAKWNARAALTDHKCKACNTKIDWDNFVRHRALLIPWFKHAQELIGALFCINCYEVIRDASLRLPIVDGLRCWQSAEEERAAVQIRRETLASHAALRDGSRRCTRCDSSHTVTNNAGYELWSIGKSVVPALQQYRTSTFCNRCSCEARQLDVKALSTRAQANWVDDMEDRDRKKEENKQKRKSARAEKVKDAGCIACGEPFGNNRAVGAKGRLPDLNEYHDAFLCVKDRNAMVSRPKKMKEDGLVFGAAEQRALLAEVREMRGYAQHEEEDDEEEE
ncbi:hypothetical protein LTR17_023958 [Elasticomyces elasticus]|nr:hypothetical protein LTR17_023958 [Elasticomyces elasticus]